MTNDKPFFKPWKGSHYGPGSRFGTGVLVVGESHYGSGHDTISVVKDWRGRPHRFFTGIAMILLGVAHRRMLDWADRKAVWDDIAFYNYFQEFVGDRPRVPPRADLWAKAEAPFRRVLHELHPDIVVVFSKRLRGHLERTEATLANRVVWARHPSGRGWNLSEKQRLIGDFQAAVTKCQRKRTAVFPADPDAGPITSDDVHRASDDCP